MTYWLFGAAIALLVGFALTFYLWFIRRRDDETAAGLMTLAGLRWREFQRLVLEAMKGRDLKRVMATVDEDTREENSSNLLLRGPAETWLLASKHGIAYRIGSAAIEEIASEMRLRGAQRGLLVTEGSVDGGGQERARKYNVEILDGRRLWPELKPVLDPVIRQRIVDDATAKAKRHIGIAWLGALTLGLASGLVLSSFIGAPREQLERTTAPAVTPAATAPAASAAVAPQIPTSSTASPPDYSHPAPRAPVPTPPAAAPTQPMTERQMDEARASISRQMKALKTVSRGVWISRSTLAVDRVQGDEDAAMAEVCAVLARYPDLNFSRIQLNPPTGSTQAVHWRQCGATVVVPH
ncbi:MAG: restriction endonuclease [Pseudoxanthomonas sp.]